ncbi:MAG TPA: aminotransferase class I/II-fold pyridoxal phosphate-dependent enzyme [Chitinophagales bacterium]|nr:aminotransferase class I/II-fold pyridoxal phosphate-dependent enzyme [Chitinophagales bacterium]
MSGEEQRFVNDAFDSNWIAPLGAHVDGFEQELSAFTGSNDCAALSSGTAALHLALIMLSVGKGDIVICPTLTFSASANPIIYQGATPVFVDCDATSWNMDPNLCESAIKELIAKGKKPKAIILVHLYGMPSDMDAFIRISHQYDIPLIEDAAESLGATYRNQHTGTFGEFGILSFNGNKVITTSGGGALLCKTKEQANYARFLATQARDNAPHYQHSVIGYNYRLSNICAAIGRGQMTVLSERVQRRREIFHYYYNNLKDTEGISFSAEMEQMKSSRWLTTILINPDQTGTDREQIRLLLGASGIESRPIWKPMHLQPVFNDATTYNQGVAENIFQYGLCLPSGSSLTTAQQQEIIDLIRSAVK